MKSLISIISFLLLTTSVMAQNVVSGTIVTAKSGEPVTGANVMVRNGENKVLKFCISDVNGTFRIDMGEKMAEGLFLYISMVGMDTYSSPLGQKTENLEISLCESENQLKEITVKADKIKENGDTITYLTSSFAKDNDRTIGDVLKRMPGISVEKNGRIQYQGVDINKFYIEGSDLLGGKYGIATNGISKDDIGAVEVLENHQPMQVLRGISLSDQAAINLKLKNGAKSTWILHGDLGTGVSANPKQVLWKGQLFAMMAKVDYQSITTFKSNNTGTDITTDVEDFLSQKRNTDITPYVSVSMPNTASLEKSRTLFNRTHLFSTNHLWKKGNVDIKFQTDYLNNRETSSAATKTTYFLADENRVIEEHLQGKRHENRATSNFIVEANQRKYFLNNTFSAECDWDNIVLDMKGNLNTNQNFRKPNYYLNNNLKYLRMFGDRHLITFTSENEFETLPQRFSVVYDANEERRSLVQHIDDRTFFSREKAEYGFAVKGALISFETGVSAYIRTMNSDLQSDTILVGNGYNDLGANYVTIYTTPKIEYSKGVFDFTLRYPISYTFYRFDQDINNSSKFFLSPRVSVRYKPTSRINISLSGGMSENPMDLQDIHDGEIASDYRTVLHGISEFYTLKSKNLSLSSSYRHPVKGIFSSVFATRAWNSIPFRSSQTFIGDCIYQDFAAENTNSCTTTLNGSITKTVDWINGGVTVRASYLENERQIIAQGRNTESALSSYSMKFSINGSISTYIGWLYSFDYSSNKMALNGIKNSSLNNFQHTAKLSVMPQKALIFELGGEYYRNEIQKDNYKNLLMCDAKALYRISKRYELSLSVNNLLDKRSYSYISYGTISSIESSRQLRGREIMISFFLKK